MMMFKKLWEKNSNLHRGVINVQMPTEPIFKFRPCQLFVLLVFVVNIPNSTEKMLALCYQSADMLYGNRPLLFKVP